MDCSEIQERLLELDPIRAQALPPELAGHVNACPACRELVRELARIEQAVRELPVPAQAAAAKERFLRRLAESPAAALAPARPTIRRLFTWPRVAAALMLLAAGVAISVLIAPQPPEGAQAAGLVERVVDWDLELASRPSLEERRTFCAAAAQEFQTLLGQAPAGSAETVLARKLYDHGLRLSASIDPLVEAEVLSGMADLLVPELEHAARSDPKAIKHKIKLASRIEQEGVFHRLQKIDSAERVEGERAKRLERVLHRNDRYRSRMEALSNRVSEKDRQEIRQSLDATKYHPKKLRTPGGTTGETVTPAERSHGK